MVDRVVVCYFDGQMDALREIIHRSRYNQYHRMPDEIEPIFTIFLTVPTSQYTIQDI
jgi:hypothetical protein